MGKEVVISAAKEIIKNATGGSGSGGFTTTRSRAIPINDPAALNQTNGGGLFNLVMTVLRIVIFAIIAVYICK
jgi:hypothetical protein